MKKLIRSILTHPVLYLDIRTMLKVLRDYANGKLHTVEEAEEAKAKLARAIEDWGKERTVFVRQNAALAELLWHGLVHGAYADMGFMQMTTAQKKLYVSLLESWGLTASVARLSQFIVE